jgi:acetyl-CoA acetyltransferase
MCAPISDGAAAAVLCSPAGLASLSADSGRAVRVRASVLRSATERGWSALDAHIGRLAALAAYEEAGLGAHEIDVVELHDATAFSELMLTESLGLCPRGEGGVLAESGATSMGGHVPVNPSGGLECKGHPVAATGLGQIYELVLQLRGEAGPRQVEGARIALQENGGGIWGYEEASTHVGILERN